MNRKSITEEYFALAINESGYMPAMYRDESNAGVVAAGVMDLLLNQVITEEKKKITVIKDLPDYLGHLASLYAYLKEKTRPIDKLMGDYTVSAGSRLGQLAAETGEALTADHRAVKEKGGLFGGKVIYIPDQGYRAELISVIKAAVSGEEEITPHDAALISILAETKNLNRYLSREERSSLKGRLKEIRRNPQNKELADMINHVSDMTAIIAAWIVTSSLSR